MIMKNSKNPELTNTYKKALHFCFGFFALAIGFCVITKDCNCSHFF